MFKYPFRVHPTSAKPSLDSPVYRLPVELWEYILSWVDEECVGRLYQVSRVFWYVSMNAKYQTVTIKLGEFTIKRLKWLKRLSDPSVSNRVKNIRIEVRGCWYYGSTIGARGIFRHTEIEHTNAIWSKSPINPIRILEMEWWMYHLSKTLRRLVNVSSVSMVTLGDSAYPSRGSWKGSSPLALERVVRVIWTLLGPRIRHLRIENSWPFRCCDGIILPKDLTLPCLTSISTYNHPRQRFWLDSQLQFIQRHYHQIRSLETTVQEPPLLISNELRLGPGTSRLNEVTLMVEYPNCLRSLRTDPILQGLQRRAPTLLRRFRIQVELSSRNWMYGLTEMKRETGRQTTLFLTQDMGFIFSNLTWLVMEPNPLSSWIPILQASSETLRELQICHAELKGDDLRKVVEALRGPSGMRLTHLGINHNTDTLTWLPILDEVKIPQVWLYMSPIKGSLKRPHPAYTVTQTTVVQHQRQHCLVCVFDSTLESNLDMFEWLCLYFGARMTVKVVHRPQSDMKSALDNPCGPGGCQFARMEENILDAMYVK